jgi:hypothetical protein
MLVIGSGSCFVAPCDGIGSGVGSLVLLGSFVVIVLGIDDRIADSFGAVVSSWENALNVFDDGVLLDGGSVVFGIMVSLVQGSALV